MLLASIGPIAASGAGATAFESIATITTSGGESSITFSSIPQTYASLQVRCLFKDTSTTDSTPTNVFPQIVPNTSFPGARQHTLIGNGSTVSASSPGGYDGFALFGAWIGSNATFANMYGVAIVDIHDYTSTTRNKTARIFAGSDSNGAGTVANRVVALSSGVWLSTSAVTSLYITPGGSGFAAGSKFALYGIKGA